MECHKNANKKCCEDEINIIQIDGTYTCTICGLVLDVHYMGYDRKANTFNPRNYILDEYCQRGNIDSYSQSLAEEMFDQYSKIFPSLHKETLIATCLYIACKRNLIPRTMREINGFTGCTIKRLGQYEQLITNVHYPTEPIQFVERFCGKLNLRFEQIQKVLNAVRKSENIAESFNPAGIACAYIYKTLTGNTVDLQALAIVSGIPATSIRRISKNI